MEDSIEIPVNLNTKGFQRGSQQLKSAIKSMGNATKGFGRTIRQTIKTILGMGAAYQIISKAVSAYMSQNEKLSQKMNSIWTAFGNLLGPIIERMIGWVTSAVSYLLSFLKLLGVTNKTASQLSTKAKKGAGDLQKTVAGFDELNKLQDKKDEAHLDDKDPTAWMQKIQDLISGKKWEQLGQEIGKKITEFIVSIPKKISELIKKVDWKEVGRAIVGVIKGLFEGISVRDILDSLVTLAHNIWNAFLDALWGAMDDGSGKEPPIVESLRSLGDAIERLYNTIMDHWEKDIKPLFKDAWDNVIAPLLKWLIETALPWLIEKLTDLINYISDNWEWIQPILLFIGATLLGWNLASKVATLASTIGGPLVKVLGLAGKAFSGLWGIIMANPIILLIAAIVGLVVLIATKGDEIQALLQKLDDWLQGIFAKDWTEVFGPVLGGILNGFFDTVKGIWDGIKQVFDGIIDFIRGVFTGDWERAWKGVKEIFSGIAKSLITVFKSPLNGIIKLINAAIDGINLMIDKINGTGIMTFLGWSIPKIPGKISPLAKGGVLKKGQVGVLEGDGAEAVVPLEKNTEWIGKVADGFVDRLSANQGVAKGIAALSAIGDSVAFKMPAVAAGTVTPYSVSSANSTNTLTGDESEILRLIEALYELLERFVNGMDNMQFVAQFDDLRALAKRITKEQKRQTISEGR